MSGSRRGSIAKDVILFGGLVVVAVGLIVYLVMRDEGRPAGLPPSASQTLPKTAVAAEPGAGTGDSQPDPMAVARRTPGDPLAVGKPDAPVTLVMFGDYRCPFCAKFSRDTEPELVDRYVSSGTLRIEWRDMPIFGEQSMLAARAGRAAAQQGKFWEFNRAVFAVAPERGHADLTESVLVDFAKQVGIPDLGGFSSALHSSAFDAPIALDLAQATTIGVPSTPAFVINGMPILGAQPTEQFVQAIDDAAARQ